MEAVEIHLPGGIPVGEHWYRNAWVKPITGYEEEFLLREGRLIPPAARVTQLLTRCLSRLGPLQPVEVDVVRRLSVGDREALLLHLRRLTLGERMSCLFSCPNCGLKMDLDLQITELLLPAYPRDKTVHEVQINEGTNSYHVVFRLPNGEDQEAVAALAAESVELAAETLLRRCIERVTCADGEQLASAPAVVLREVSAKMAELDPQAELLLDLTCTECAAGFVVPFDVADYVCREIAGQEHEFYRELHMLSFHYHWNESSILGMSRHKRQIYLDLLAEEISRGGRDA